MGNSSFSVGFLVVLLVIAQCWYMGGAETAVGCRTASDCKGRIACTHRSVVVCVHNMCSCETVNPADIIIDQGTKLGCMKDSDCADRLTCKVGEVAACGHNMCHCKTVNPAIDQGTKLGCMKDSDCDGRVSCKRGQTSYCGPRKICGCH